MEAFERHIHIGAKLEQRVIKIRLDGRAQHRIAEPARRQVFEIAIVLLAQAMRRLVEDEEFELRRDSGGEAASWGAIDHPAKQTARADRFRGSPEFAAETQHV